jgi:regulator of sigma E protease
VPKGIERLWDTVVVSKNEVQIRLAHAFGGSSTGASLGGGPALQGPVGIASTTGDIVDQAGWRALIELAALLSLNLGIFNALPLPMLDGGRMFFVFIEILRGGRRIAPEKEALVHLTGFALMLAGVVAVTWFDIARLIS